MSLPSSTQNVAVLSIGSLKLAFPQSDIVSVDVVADVRQSDETNQQVAATLHRQDAEWCVYAFSEKLILQSQLSESSRFCVCIKRDDIFYALACDGVEVIKLDADVPQQALSEIMKNEYTPVLKLMKIKQDITLMVDALSVNHYLDFLGALDVE